MQSVMALVKAWRSIELSMMGQDIADYGGVFKSQEALSKVGKERVRNTPFM